MALLQLLLLPPLLYLLYIITWFFTDCNLALWYQDHFGFSIWRLHGQVVWITGASSGIGRALALKLASHGVRLVLSARRKALLEQLYIDCLKQAGGVLKARDVLVLPMDMLEIDKHQQHFQRVLEHFGRLDVLVNNAGRSQRANWEEIKVQVDRELFELDVFSVMHLSRIAVRYFLQEAGGRGHLAVTSSIAGFCVVPQSATYCGAKHALNAYMKALRMEHRQIDVTVFAPGAVATDFLEEAFTAETDRKCGKSTTNQRRMSAERCAHLFAVAIANKMDFTWCTLFPANFLTYMSRYPTVWKILLYFIGKRMINRIREGKV